MRIQLTKLNEAIIRYSTFCEKIGKNLSNAYSGVSITDTYLISRCKFVCRFLIYLNSIDIVQKMVTKGNKVLLGLLTSENCFNRW